MVIHPFIMLVWYTTIFTPRKPAGGKKDDLLKLNISFIRLDVTIYAWYNTSD